MQLGRICVRVGIEETEVRGGKKKKERKKRERQTGREGEREEKQNRKDILKEKEVIFTTSCIQLH